MALGPILIFDKSMLQSLNPDEAVWLDNFFLTNITPIFFAETLADLQKEIRAGRTAEQVVGNLAYKTPDMGSRPSVHHYQLLVGELAGVQPVAMDGRMMVPGGQPVQLEGSTGVLFQKTKEEEAFNRWQRGEFLDLERQIARAWRQSLSNVNYKEAYEFFQGFFEPGKKPKTLQEAKSLAIGRIDGIDQERSLQFGLSLLSVPEEAHEIVMARWRAAGKPPLHDFAPYFRYLYEVDLFFFLAIAADLISRVRPANKADNKVDLAYLYYLPFCMVFTSSDNLHERMVPLFLREDQTFVSGSELKADFGKLDQHYSSLPNEVKSCGLFSFASYPPSDTSFLVTRLWDKHLPIWREHAAKPRVPEDKDKQRAIVDQMNRLKKEAQPIDPATRLAPEDTQFIQLERNVLMRKGKWTRFSPEVEAQVPNKREEES